MRLRPAYRLRVSCWLIAACLLFPLMGQAQINMVSAAEPGFSAVTIKPSNISRAPLFMLLREGNDVYLLRNVPIMLVVLQAYLGESTSDRRRIKGAPAWAMTDRFDIQIKLNDAAMIAWKGLSRSEKIAKMAPLMRQMLSERCGVQAHTGPIMLDGFAIELNKSGPKPTPTPADHKYPESISKWMEDSPGLMNTLGHSGKLMFSQNAEYSPVFFRGAIDDLAEYFRPAGIPLVDQTGLKGSFDLMIPVDPEPPLDAGAPPPDLFVPHLEEIRSWRWEAVGLKLRPVKVPGLEVIVDHMERPTPN